MKLRASQYGLLILVVMVITRAFLLDREEVDTDHLFSRDDAIASAYNESTDLRAETYSVQNLIATANSIVFDGGINYEDFASSENNVYDFTPIVAAVIEESTPASTENDLLAMNDVASSDGGQVENLPIELQLFAPSQKHNRTHPGNDEFAEASVETRNEPVESIPLDGESTITEQMARLFPRNN